MSNHIRSVNDLSDDEIVQAIEGIQSESGSYLVDPLEGPLVVITGRAIVAPEPTFFDDVRQKYAEIMETRKES